MAAAYRRKKGQIPAFGDWENTGGLPITQYFECARQAGLPRCSCSRACPGSSSGSNGSWGDGGRGGAGGVHASGFMKSPPRRMHSAPQPKMMMETRAYNRKGSFPRTNEQNKYVRARKFIDNSQRDQPSSDKHYNPKQGFNSANPRQASFSSKPVDEDLYKVPSEHLRNPKRKNVLGLFSRCMTPPCS